MFKLLQAVREGIETMLIPSKSQHPNPRSGFFSRLLGEPARRQILFIGLTQNGKSSTIQSILRYSGDEKQAKLVELGEGSLSKTKEVGLYDIDAPQRNHLLFNTETSEHVSVADATLDDDLDLENIEEDVESANLVALTLIDSPGLSDTSNCSTTGDDGDDSVLTPRVDDLHRLKVIKALAEAGGVHSVCFVIMRGNQYGEDFQRHVRAYLDIFRASGILDKVNFHILHTAITVEDQSVKSTYKRLRQQEFAELINIKATHHWLENDPLRNSPIALHHSRVGFATLIRAFQQDKYVRLKSLEYPKTTRHKALDNDLRVAYLHLIESYRAEKEVVLSELTGRFGLEKEISNIAAPIAGYKREKRALEVRADGLDKFDLVVIGGDPTKKFKESVWHNPAPTLRWRLNTTVDIREITKDPEDPPNGWWVEHNKSDRNLDIDYEANPLSDASASVVLKGYLRDVHEGDIIRYRQHAQQFETKIKDINKKIEPLEQKVRNIHAKAAAIDELIDGLNVDLKKSAQKTSSLTKGNTKGAYFLAQGLYSIALAYGLSTTVSINKLPTYSTIDTADVIMTMRTRKKMATRRLEEALLEEMRLTSLVTTLFEQLESLQFIIEEKGQKMKDLDKVYAELEAESMQGTDHCDSFDEGYSSLDSTPSETPSESPEPVIGMKMQAMQQEYALYAQKLQDAEAELGKVTKNHVDAAAKLEGSKRSAKVARAKAQLDAAVEVMEYAQLKEVPMRVFAVLYTAVLQNDPKPYTQLHREVAESILLAQDLLC